MSDVYNPKATLRIGVDTNEIDKANAKVAELKKNVEKGIKLDPTQVKHDLTEIANTYAKATTQINDTAKSLKKLDKTISTERITAGIKNTKSEIKRLREELDAFNPKKLDIDPFQTVNMGGLLSSMRVLSRELKVIIDTTVNRLGDKINDLARDLTMTIDISSDTRMDTVLRRLSKHLKQIEEQLEKLNNTGLNLKTNAAENDVRRLDNGLENLRKKVKAIDDAIIDPQTNQFANENEQLLDQLDRIRRAIKVINETPIRVQVVNRGFDEMVSNLNRFYNSIHTITLKIANNLAKTEARQRNITISAEEFNQAINRANNSYNKLGDKVAQVASKLLSGENTLTSAALRVSKLQSSAGQFSRILLDGFYATRGIASILQQAQSFAYQISQYITSMTNTVVNQLIPAMESFIGTGFEGAGAIEDARIAYQLFFPDEDPNDIVNKIRERAIKSPVFDVTELYKYVTQFAPLSGGDSDLAIDAIEGIAAMLKASGQDTSTYLQKLVTNTMQIVSTGKATVRDWNEFLRATPVFEQVMAEVTPALRAKLNDDTAEVTKNDTTQLLRALQLVARESSISDVISIQAGNWQGLKQQAEDIYKDVSTQLTIDSGLFSAAKAVLAHSQDLDRLARKYILPVENILASFLRNIDWVELEKMLDDISRIVGQTVIDILRIFDVTASTFDTKSLRKIITDALSFLSEFFKGFAQGIKDVINMLSWLTKTFHLDTSAAFLLGWLASPGGNMWSKFLGMVEGVAQILANMFQTLRDLSSWGFFRTLMSNKAFIFSRNSALMQGVGAIGKGIKSVASKVGAAISSWFTGTAFYNNVVSKISATMHAKFGAHIISRMARFIGNTIVTAVQSAVLMLVGSGFSQLAIETGSALGNTQAGAVVGGVGNSLISGVGGAALGAQIGSLGGPIGAAIGGAIGGTLGVIKGILETSLQYQKKIKEELSSVYHEVQEQLKVARAEYAENVASRVVDAYNQLFPDNQMDAGSKAAGYAKQRVAQIIVNRGVDDYTEQELLEELASAYFYKKAAENLADFDQSEYFKSLAGVGNVFDYKTNLDLRDRLAEVIKNYRLISDAYNYKEGAEASPEALVETWLNGNTFTEAQIEAFIAQASDRTAEVTAINQTTAAIDTQTEEYKTAFQGYNDTLNKMIEKIESISHITSDGEVTVDANGNVYVTKSDGRKYGLNDDGSLGTFFGKITERIKNATDAAAEYIQKTKKIPVDLIVPGVVPNNKINTGFFNGGYVKPVYKQSGGPLGVDTVPVMAQRGEFIVRKSVAEKVGLPALTALNLGDTKLASALMGRPNINNANTSTINRSTNDNRKFIKQIVKVVNRNHMSSLNASYALANRLALNY